MNEAQRIEDSDTAGEEIVATCPSGLKGSFRGMIGLDYRHLNRQAAKSGEGFTKVLNACFTVHDPGIYKVNSAGRIDWADVLIGDHTFGLLTIRRAMYPDQPYTFKVTCKEAICRERIGWAVPLEDLPIRALPQATREALMAGQHEHEIEIRGRKVWFRLLRARDQMKRHKLIQQSRRRLEDGEIPPSDITYALAARITRVDGLDLGASDYEDFEEKIRWLEELPTSDHMRMLRAMEKADCGVDTKIEIVCKECGSDQEVDLPLDETFLFKK